MKPRRFLEAVLLLLIIVTGAGPLSAHHSFSA